MVRRIQLKDISALASGKTTIISCPKGPRYRGIFLQLGNTAGSGNPLASALATEIRVVLGGTVQRRCTAEQLDIINSAMGAQYASDAYGTDGTATRILPIFFAEPWRNRISNTSVDINALAWTTNWLGANDVFQVEVDLAAITPAVTAFAVVDDGRSDGPPGIVKWYKKDKSTSAASVQISDMFAGVPATDLFSQISCFDPSDSSSQSKQVTHAKLDILGKRRWDLSYNEMTSLLAMRDMNPAAGAYHIVFDHDDSLNDLEPAAGVSESNLELTLKASSTGTISLVSQRLGRPDAS